MKYDRTKKLFGENTFEKFKDVKLILLGVGEGDEVICQSFTFSASANPIAYQRATPVFVDSEKDTWNMDPVLLEEAIKDRLEKTGRLPKAIIPVHLYGMPGKLDEILEIANRWGYENGSKFSSAFKQIMGCNPREYRVKNKMLN